MREGWFTGGGAAWRRASIAVFALCLLAMGAQALMVPQDQAGLARSADGIVEGTVSSVESHWTADGTIETTAEIALDSTLKGAFPGRAVTVTVQGGTVGDVTQVVEDQPVLEPGDRAFFLLERGPAGYRVHGAGHGVVPVVGGEVWEMGAGGSPRATAARAYGARLAALGAGEEVAADAGGAAATAGGPVIASVSPSSAPAGTGATVTITGSGFGTKASRESRADVGFIYRCTSSTGFVPVYATGRPYSSTNANDIVSWTDTRIVVRVPTGKMSDGYDGAASSGRVWVVTDAGASSAASPFAVTFAYGRIKWASAPTFVVNNNCPGVPTAGAAVANAAKTWNAAVAGSPFRFINGGTTTSTTMAENRQNLICWRPGSSFSSGTLAVTHWWYVGSTLVECDVEFNTDFAWTAGTASGSSHSVEAIMLHEFGHWLNLRDLYGYQNGMPTDTEKVMFGFNSDGFGNLNRRTLQASDIAGARYIYGGGTPTPTPTPTATTPVPQAPYPAARVLPAQVEAEHFDAGGEGVSYHDLEPGNLGNADARAGEGVDVEAAGGVTDICYVRAGEYLEYSVDATPGGSFGLVLRAANPDTITKAVKVYLDGVPAGEVPVGPTGDWTAYQDFAASAPLSIVAGRHVVTLAFAGVDRINLDRFSLAGVTPIPSPILTAVASMPGGAGVPTDPDRDGKYEDVNGNGRADFDDAVLFFNQLTWIAANEPLSAFDYSANGRVDFADVVWLFNHL